MDNNKIFQKVKMKIAISNVKEEDTVMNKKNFNFSKKVGIVACIVLSMTGIVFAATYLPSMVNVENKSTELTSIDSLDIKIESPKIGDEITFETTPTITIDDNANYTLNHTSFINRLHDNAYPQYDINVKLAGTVEKDKDYIVEITLKSKDGFAFVKDNNITLKINGEITEYEKHDYPVWSDEDGSTYFMFFVKIQAAETGKNL